MLSAPDPRSHRTTPWYPRSQARSEQTPGTIGDTEQHPKHEQGENAARNPEQHTNKDSRLRDRVPNNVSVIRETLQYS
jgi:hypothetical protein